ncbi:MAG: glycosyltransferase [Candidatus Omnitrophota bacterium]|nr:MAG: glycosyltransferase [Candidatus Omnitrophota bacterium]
MKIALIYNKDCEFTTGVHIEKVIKDAAIDYTHFWTKDAHCIPGEFDLYFRIDHGDYKYDIPQNLRPAVFYVIDTHLKKPYKKIKGQVSHYDVIFCAQKDGSERLRREARVDAQWVPLAADPQIHQKKEVPLAYDIGFVGRDAKKFARKRHLALLREKYPNSFIGTADYRKIGDIYSASKIGFNSSIMNDINMRIFEILASGSFLLTNYIKDNGLEKLFQDKKHLVTYRNDSQLLELVEYYLKNEKERQRIAQEGYACVLNKHTYYHRVQSMFNYIAFKFGIKYNRLRI